MNWDMFTNVGLGSTSPTLRTFNSLSSTPISSERSLLFRPALIPTGPPERLPSWRWRLDFGCSGIQSSRRADERTVEILRMCANGGWMRLLWRASAKLNELVLEITEQSADGGRFDRRLTLVVLNAGRLKEIEGDHNQEEVTAQPSSHREGCW